MSGYFAVYNTIEGVGFALAFAILITVTVHPQLSRLPAWYLIMGSGATYAASMLMLAISGHQGKPEAPFALCVIQSSLIYSCPIWLLASAAAFALQFHLTTLFYIGNAPRRMDKDNKWIWIVPILIFALVTATLLAVGIARPDFVEVDEYRFYCHLKHNIGAIVVTGFSIVFAGSAVVMEVFTCKLLYRYWRISQKLDFRVRSNGVISVGTVARLVAFTVVSILSIATCGIYLVPGIDNFSLVICYNAVLTQMAPIVLGMNKSVVDTWMFWRKNHGDDSESTISDSASKTDTIFDPKGAYPNQPIPAHLRPSAMV